MTCFQKFSILLLFLLFAVTNDGIAQKTIYLANPSFEDMPRRGGDSYMPIKGWHDCGLNSFPDETPPDIHPVPRAAWEVVMQPQDGQTYLGLVVRYNSTWESLSQSLEEPLEVGNCYSISVHLARSPGYKSGTRRSDEIENFIQPAVFLIWGGNEYCMKKQLLAESQPVVDHKWTLTEFVLKPDVKLTTITIEAFYNVPILESYNGHILVDNISPIVEIACE